MTNEFIQLDRDGKQEFSIMFFKEGYVDKRTNKIDVAYMVSLPESNNEDIDYGFLKENEDIAYFRNSNNTLFFRVTEEQLV